MYVTRAPRALCNKVKQLNKNKMENEFNTKGEILAHLKGFKIATETILTWTLDEQQKNRLEIELTLVNNFLLKFEGEKKE